MTKNRQYRTVKGILSNHQKARGFALSCNICRFAMSNGLFQTAKQAVRELKTACFATL